LNSDSLNKEDEFLEYDEENSKKAGGNRFNALIANDD
jgi:hypothetical protein